MAKQLRATSQNFDAKCLTDNRYEPVFVDIQEVLGHTPSTKTTLLTDSVNKDSHQFGSQFEAFHPAPH